MCVICCHYLTVLHLASAEMSEPIVRQFGGRLVWEQRIVLAAGADPPVESGSFEGNVETS